MQLLLAIAPAILQGLMMILSWWAKKSLNDQDKKDFFQHWKSLCRILNLTDLVAKHEMAEAQLNANNEAWDAEEAKTKNNKEQGK